MGGVLLGIDLVEGIGSKSTERDCCIRRTRKIRRTYKIPDTQESRGDRERLYGIGKCMSELSVSRVRGAAERSCRDI